MDHYQQQQHRWDVSPGKPTNPPHQQQQQIFQPSMVPAVLLNKLQ